ncbi:hypothetical protein L5B71_10125 [Avibacterium sp. 21-586]|uniref:hypothetical protein n=1 Tax=Avibacterium sp. 21-586 TaxID=2911534 RepID=UPI0022454529|nr:hypothetical protein [Avibacterium sp. 21-586]MCW9711186.1 hypothetical protein [Avibacterium sp. 21-586]
MKKKAIWLIALLCVGLCFLFWQKSRLTALLSERLAQQHIQVAQVESQLFPAQLSLYNVKFQQKARWFFFEKIVLELNPIALFGGELKLNEIQLHNGNISNSQWQGLNFSLKPTALSWQDVVYLLNALPQNAPLNLQKPVQMAFSAQATRAASQIQLQGNVQLSHNGLAFEQLAGQWQFDHPLYGDVDTMALQLKQGYLRSEMQDETSHYQLDFTDLSINQIPFSQGKIQLEFQPHFINGKLALAPQGEIDFQFYQQSDRVQFSAQNIAIEQWLALFKLPVLATGRAQLKGQVALVKQQIEQGQASLQIINGKVKNVNLLAIVAQRLPINYDSARLQHMDSPFERLTTQLIWDQQKMQWQNLQLRDPYFQLVGEGTVDHVSQKCDFLVNINLREKKYQNFRLPLHFFGDCHSPQYKIESTQGLKKQLNDLFKQRLSR